MSPEAALFGLLTQTYTQTERERERERETYTSKTVPAFAISRLVVVNITEVTVNVI